MDLDSFEVKTTNGPVHVHVHFFLSIVSCWLKLIWTLLLIQQLSHTPIGVIHNLGNSM